MVFRFSTKVASFLCQNYCYFITPLIGTSERGRGITTVNDRRSSDLNPRFKTIKTVKGTVEWEKRDDLWQLMKFLNDASTACSQSTRVLDTLE